MKISLTTLCALLFITFTSFAQTPVTPVYESLAEIAPPKGPTTTMEFEELEYDFGVIESGERVRYTYVFTNTGGEPLILTNAKGSCGCTVPNWPKVPVMPGEKGAIVVQFDSKGKKGKQSKRVTLTANTDPGQTFLTIKGEVLKAEGEEDLAVQSKLFDKLEKSGDEKVEKRTKQEEYDHKDCFAIFPNPTTDILKIDIKEHAGKSANINIFNAMGQHLASKTIDNISGEMESFEVSQYSPGTYFVSIQIDNETPSTKCFVIAKR